MYRVVGCGNCMYHAGLDRTRIHGHRSIKGELEAVKAVTAIRKSVMKLEELVRDLSDAVEEERKQDINEEIDNVYANCRAIALHIQDRSVPLSLLEIACHCVPECRQI